MEVSASKFSKISFNKILLYYSVIFSTIIMIGGIYSARSIPEMIAAILFVPVALYLWMTFWRRNKIKTASEEHFGKEYFSEDSSISEENGLAKDRDYFAKLRQ